MNLITAWAPYLMVVLLLLLTRIVPPIQYSVATEIGLNPIIILAVQVIDGA